MSLEVRQLVLRANVQGEAAGDAEADANADGGECSCDDPDANGSRPALPPGLLAACRAIVREELRALKER